MILTESGYYFPVDGY